MKLQLPNVGNGGRLGNHLFTIASLLGIAWRHGYQPVIPSNWAYRDFFPNIPDEYFGRIEPTRTEIKEHRYEYCDLTPRGDICNLGGYVQSPKYWAGYEERIIAMLQPYGDKQPSGKTAICYRRGDYVNSPHYITPILRYYLSAADEMGGDIEVICDDQEWVNLHHSGQQQRINELDDFCRIMNCSRSVLSNSTFGWWAAYIGRHERVLRPQFYFKGPNLGSYSTMDFWPDNYQAWPESCKADLQDVTFVIPFSYDHDDRLQNIRFVTAYLQHYFDCNITIGEINTDKLPDADMRFDYAGQFHRTNAINEMTRAASTRFVFNWDCDVIVPPFQILESVRRLRAGADVVYPYDGDFALVPRHHFAQVSADYNLEPLVKPIYRLGNTRGTQSVGGALGYNRHRFLKAGGENERFVSYNPEDQERYWRFNLLGMNVQRVPGKLFHMEHYRGPNSRMDTPESKRGHEYWKWLKELNKEQLIDHMGLNWNEGYSGGWALQDALKEHAFSLELAYHICKMIPEDCTVWDIGAGPGFYSAYLRHHGRKVFAVDASPEVGQFSLTAVNQHDITQPLPHQFHVALCLEVGEHIPADHEYTVLNNIAAAASKVIIMSWAVPGQDGFGHVNCQPNEYIIGQMQQRGWRHDAGGSEYLRQHCAGCSWFESTILVFTKD